MASLKTVLAIIALLGMAAPAAADVLIIDKLEQAPRSLPDRGVSMQHVQARYGSPAARVGPTQCGASSHMSTFVRRLKRSACQRSLSIGRMID